MNYIDAVLSLLKKVPRDVYFVVVILGLVASIQHTRNEALQAKRTSQLQVDSLVAANDTTRIMNDKAINFYIKRIVQTDLKVDALNKKLKTESSTRATLQFLVDSVYGAAEVDDSEMSGDTIPDVLTIPFHGYTKPFTISGSTIIDFVEDTAGVKYDVKMDPLGVTARIECGKQVINGVRTASMVVQAPSFVRVTLDTLTQSPDVCSPPPSIPVASSKNRSKLWTVAGFGVGVWVGRKYLK